MSKADSPGFLFFAFRADDIPTASFELEMTIAHHQNGHREARQN
jgi:hypothetical protein